MKSAKNIENCIHNSELLELLNQTEFNNLSSQIKISIISSKDENFLNFLFESNNYNNKVIDLTLTCDISDITSHNFLFFKIACQHVVNKHKYLTILLCRIILSYVYYNCTDHFTLNQINEITLVIKDHILAANISKHICFEIYVITSTETRNNFKSQLNNLKNKSIFLCAIEKVLNDAY